MDKHDDDIKEIIDKINAGKDKNASPNSFEFEIGNSPFEPTEEKAVSDEKTESIHENKTPPSENKQSEPNIFDTAEASSAEHEIETPSGIFTAYVPRFTEVSEHYRMVDDPRRKTGKGAIDVRAESQKEASTPQITDDKIDPTAEMENKTEDAVLVSMGTPKPDEDADSINVFKFSENGNNDNSKRERTVEQEREEIRRLIYSKKEPEAKEAEKSEPAEEIPEEETVKEYDLPDPDSGFNVFDFEDGAESPSISPDGVSEYVPDKKGGLREFELPIQRDRIKDKFLDAIMACRIRFCAVCFFTLLILGYEICTAYKLFELSRFAIFSISGSSAIIDLLLAASVFLLAIPETITAFKSLFGKKLVSDIAVPISFLVLCGYTFGIVFVSVRVSNFPLFGFVFALFALFSVYGTLCKMNADFTAFKLVSKNGEKQILEKKLTRELAEENYALDGLVDEYKSRTARIFRAAFITDFFKRTSAVSERSSHSVLMLAVTFGVSLVSGLVTYFLSQSFNSAYYAFTSFTLVFLLGLPVFALLSHKLPYKHAEEYAVSEDSTALGEGAYLDFSEVDVICFEDTEIFGIDDVNLKRFMLYGDRDNMENVMRKMCSLFSVVKGPLYSIFAGALDNRVRHNPALNTVIEQDGLSGEVSGKIVCAGSEDYMIRHGIAIPEGASGNERKNDTTKIMYAAEGKEVYAKFYIRYSFSEEFTMLLPSLKERGIIPLIYTSDPNLSNELLRRLTAGADCMRVMKRLTAGTTDEKLHNRVSAAMITVGDKINAINLVLLSKKYKRFTERISASELTAMIMGIIAGVAASVFMSYSGALKFPVAFFGIWHLLWCAVLGFSSKSRFLKEKKRNEKQNNDD